jgi:hypothetical protein
MIREVEEAILESLKKGFSEHIPPENIISGEPDFSKTKSISLTNTGFTIEELGIGGSGGVKKEEIMDKFDSDGIKKDFKLTQKPLHPLMNVESPAGTKKKELDDYTINYAGGLVSFRSPPEKGKDNVQIKYYIARAVGETRNIKFILTFSLAVWANDPNEKNNITLEVVKVFYRERSNLAKRGISEIRLIKGYSTDAGETKKVIRVDYQVESTIHIEMPLPPIEKIEIGNLGK